MVREVLGWICFAVAGVCAVGVFMISARTRNPHELEDPRNVFEKDYEHQQKLLKNPLFRRFLFTGIVFGIAGFVLIMME